MSKVNVGQNLLDKAVELTGSIEKAFEIAMLNKVSVTDSFAHNATLNYTITNKGQLLEELEKRGIKPATVIDESTDILSRIFFEEMPQEFF